MSSEDIARVRVLFRKARELSGKGHSVRASENFGRAAEAARALDSGSDNLIAVYMQTFQAAMLLNYLTTVPDDSANSCVLAAHRAEFVALLSAVGAALERRRVACTLLEGKCTAAEEAWFAGEWWDPKFSVISTASKGKLVGYSTFLLAADAILCFFRNPWYFRHECTATQLHAFAQLVVRAADLMQLPRSHGTLAVPDEINVAQNLSSGVEADELGVPHLQRRGLDASLVQLLADAWQRLQRSGVLEARDLVGEHRRLELSTRRDKSHAAVHTALAAPGLRSCALAGCGTKEAHPQHFKSCSACRTVVYCRKEHQVEGWPAHKKACRAAAKAAADGGGAGPGAAGASA